MFSLDVFCFGHRGVVTYDIHQPFLKFHVVTARVVDVKHAFRKWFTPTATWHKQRPRNTTSHWTGIAIVYCARICPLLSQLTTSSNCQNCLKKASYDCVHRELSDVSTLTCHLNTPQKRGRKKISTIIGEIACDKMFNKNSDEQLWIKKKIIEAMIWVTCLSWESHMWQISDLSWCRLFLFPCYTCTCVFVAHSVHLFYYYSSVYVCERENKRDLATRKRR